MARERYLYLPGSDGSATGFGRLTLRLRQVPRLLGRGLRHPSWLIETARGRLRRGRSARMAFTLADHADLFADEVTAVAQATGSTPAAAGAALADAWSPLDDLDLGGHPLYGARVELVRVAAAIVTLLGPDHVVETGVAQGVTTAAMLDALGRRGHGHLDSIDLPVLDADEPDFVGRLVPERLRARWTLHRGPSRLLLGPLVERLGEIDLFLHDADHSYQAQLEELRTVWPHLRAGGVVLFDDVGNPAFLDFASEVAVDPRLIGDPAKRDAMGLLRKP